MPCEWGVQYIYYKTEWCLFIYPSKNDWNSFPQIFCEQWVPRKPRKEKYVQVRNPAERCLYLLCIIDQVNVHISVLFLFVGFLKEELVHNFWFVHQVGDWPKPFHPSVPHLHPSYWQVSVQLSLLQLWRLLLPNGLLRSVTHLHFLLSSKSSVVGK